MFSIKWIFTFQPKGSSRKLKVPGSISSLTAASESLCACENQTLCGKQSLCAQGRGLAPEGPKAPGPLCSQPFCKMPPQLHATYTHHPADADITGAALWFLADGGSVCSMLTSFQVSSGEKEMLELMEAKQHGLHVFSASQNVTCSVGSLETLSRKCRKSVAPGSGRHRIMWTQTSVSRTTGLREEHPPKQKWQQSPATGLGSISS